jgi:hypothetical protein
MEAIRFSATSADFHRTIWRYIPEDRTLPVYFYLYISISVLEVLIFRKASPPKFCMCFFL